MSMAYSFGVLGGDLSVSNSSSPLTMNMNNCIQISNGIAKFSSVNKGSFVNTCVVDLNYSKMSIQISPNPFNDALFITFKSKIDKENHFKIAVYNNIGQLVKIENVYQDLFYTGYRLAMSNLINGTYFLQISSSRVNEMFKIIKND
jgi:Tfp pilus tip-associated adhesin PilY1